MLAWSQHIFNCRIWLKTNILALCEFTLSPLNMKVMQSLLLHVTHMLKAMSLTLHQIWLNNWSVFCLFCLFCLSCLSLDAASIGFIIIIDRRKDKWSSVKASLSRIAVSPSRRLLLFTKYFKNTLKKGSHIYTVILFFMFVCFLFISPVHYGIQMFDTNITIIICPFMVGWSWENSVFRVMLSFSSFIYFPKCLSV